jgi:hypothetical protein
VPRKDTPLLLNTKNADKTIGGHDVTRSLQRKEVFSYRSAKLSKACHREITLYPVELILLEMNDEAYKALHHVPDFITQNETVLPRRKQQSS